MKKVAILLSGCLLAASLNTSAAPDYGVSEGNEELLIQGLQSLSTRDFDSALKQFRELTEIRPDFRLAQLVYADLLAAQVNPLGQVGSNLAKRQKEVEGLIAEARARLQMESKKPQAGLIPSSLIKMSEDQRYLLAVDTGLSRLFVIENHNGTPRVVKDYYASYGRGGVVKEKRGDLKTPLGVYFVTKRLLDKDLPQRYGSGALPINYPNVWDKRHGRTGSGIWVHGSPVNTYSRPPLASEGCVSLTNPDFLELDKLVDIKNTPVLIGEHFNWIPVAQWQQQQKEMAAVLEAWRSDWESRLHDQYIAHYSTSFSDGSTDFSAFSKHKQRVNGAKSYIDVKLNNVSLFRYPNDPNLMVASFEQHYKSDNYHSDSIKRQYWVKEGGRWKIAYEGEPSQGIP